MANSTVIPLRAGAGAYSDTAALNDIHALLTTKAPGESTLADIALILGRAGRPMIRARDIEVATTETALGWPVVCVSAGDTDVYVRQAPAGPGLLIEICTETDAEARSLAVTLDGAPLRPTGTDDDPPPF